MMASGEPLAAISRAVPSGACQTLDIASIWFDSG